MICPCGSPCGEPATQDNGSSKTNALSGVMVGSAGLARGHQFDQPSTLPGLFSRYPSFLQDHVNSSDISPRVLIGGRSTPRHYPPNGCSATYRLGATTQVQLSGKQTAAIWESRRAVQLVRNGVRNPPYEVASYRGKIEGRFGSYQQLAAAMRPLQPGERGPRNGLYVGSTATLRSCARCRACSSIAAVTRVRAGRGHACVPFAGTRMHPYARNRPCNSPL